MQIRPKILNEFIGKKDIVDNLKVFIQSSKIKNRTLDHILLYGLPGTGKTTIANIVATELGKKIKIIQGTNLKKNIDLINLVSLVNDGDVVFIDEIQAISLECAETLYSIMEDFCIDIVIGKDNETKTTRLPLPKFTLIGATTSIGLLPKPLIDRFEISFYFDNYDEEEIFQIIKQNSIKNNININDEQLEIIASHCKGIPRLANKILKRVNDFILVNNDIELNSILKKLQIYEFGLLEIDLIYLKSLLSIGRNVGLKTICSLTNLDAKTIENNIEPFLLKNNFIQKGINGRSITEKGEIFMQQKIKEGIIKI